MKIPAPLPGVRLAQNLPKGVRLVTGPLSQEVIAELVCIPLDMDEVAYDCWMDAALLN
jgi:hypothetical protein